MSCAAVIFVAACCLPTAVGQEAKEESATSNLTVVENNLLQASAQTPQVVRGDRLHDFHYAYSIARPDGDWQFLNKKKAQAVVPDAAMVMTKQQALVAVIAEPVPGTDLREYCDIVIEGLGQYDPLVMTRKRIVVDGETATEMRLDATVESIDFIYLFTVVRRGDWFYKIAGWALRNRYREFEDEIRSIARSLKLNRDREPQVRQALDIADSFGPTWVVRDGVYTNAVFGFRLKPAIPLRVISRKELIMMGPDAVAGLASGSPTFNQLVVSERANPEKTDAFVDKVLRNAAAELGITSSDPETSNVTIDGESGKQYLYRDTKVGGLPLDVAQTVFFRDQFFFRLQSWWFSKDAQAASKLLDQSYQTLQWLSESEREQVAATLKHRDASNVVGEDFSLRQNVYRDFKFGFDLSFPEGLWRVLAGSAAKNRNESSRVIGDLIQSGCHVTVIAERAGFGNRQYHTLVLAQMNGQNIADTTRMKVGPIEFLGTEFDLPLDGFLFRFHLITAAQGDRHVQLLCSSLHSNRDQLEGFAGGMMRGLRFHKDIPKPVVRTPNSIEDHRVGYGLTFPDGWTATREVVAGLEAPGSTYSIDSGDVVSCAASGFCDRLGAVDQQLMINALLSVKEMKQKPGTLTEFDTIVDNQPAKEISFEILDENTEHDLFATVWLMERGNSIYTYLVIYDFAERRNLSQYKQFFYLID